ncbi:MAG TPA: thioesterase family protein [Longimicrobium sp.]|jgi:acyl-CoA thioester hydrolase|uniref:acyl-CoA thioesterase n=1 Tax=Longimicrobium sp. TaxID=2029185 RepID=UPI002EDA8021
MQPVAPSCALEFRARYSETDQMGIIYHANYLVWCEIGRTELIRRLWKPYSQVEKDEGVLLAVTDVTLRYHASARYEDLIRVTTTLEQVRSRAVAFAYLIERVEEDGTTTRLCTARTGLTALDRAGAPRKLPPDLLDAFRAATEPAS